jgi:hypothetical protein
MTKTSTDHGAVPSFPDGQSGRSPHQYQHRPRGRALFPDGQSGRSPHQDQHRPRTDGQSGLSRCFQDQHRPRGRAPFPRRAELAVSQSIVAEPCHIMDWGVQTGTSIEQDQHGPGGRARFPRQTRTSGSTLMSHHTRGVRTP